jgi:hypothetical protein
MYQMASYLRSEPGALELVFIMYAEKLMIQYPLSAVTVWWASAPITLPVRFHVSTM